MKNCEVCGKVLIGKQEKYCSKWCKDHSKTAKARFERFAKSDKRKDYMARYREDNREQIREWQKKHEHSKKRKHYLKKYYSEPENKQRRREAVARFMKTDKGKKVLQRFSQTDKQKEIYRRYKHSEKGRARNKRQHARVRIAKLRSVKPVTNEDLLKIFKRDKNTCVYCGKKKLLHTGSHQNSRVPDHIIPMNGPTDRFWDIPENIVTACYECNSKKHDKEVHDFCNEECLKVPLIVKKLILQRKQVIHQNTA